MGVVSEQLKDVDDDLGDEELVLVKLDVGGRESALRAEEARQL